MKEAFIKDGTAKIEPFHIKVQPEPLIFPSHGSPLYGLFCPAVRACRGGTAVVACHGVGLEHAVTSRMVAMAVRQAAGQGYPALLYHSRGHGDSGGDFAEITFESLVEDALSAANHVLELSNAKRVVWLGVRVGALVVAEAATRHSGSAGLVLWEPVATGAEYFRQLVRGLLYSAVVRGEKATKTVDEVLEEVERDGQVDIHACYLYAKLYLSLREAGLARILERWTAPVFLAQIQPRLKLSPSNTALVAALERRGVKVSVTNIAEQPGWQFLMWGQPWTSSVLLEDTMRWLNELA